MTRCAFTRAVVLAAAVVTTAAAVTTAVAIDAVPRITATKHIVDARGRSVGQVQAFTKPPGALSVPAPQIVLRAHQRDLVLWVMATYFIGTDEALYFASSDCSGTPHIQWAPSSDGADLIVQNVVGPTVPFQFTPGPHGEMLTTGLTIYVPTAPAQPLVARSAMGPSSYRPIFPPSVTTRVYWCYTVNQPIDGLPAAAVVDVLRSFTPPFSMR